jgi:D,D-heptose 1,7-bisphosphate phosphatase
VISSARAVFLDRDGVLIEDPGHLVGVEQVRILPGAVEAIRAFRSLGHRVVVITNQSVIARGMLTVPGLAHIHALLTTRLAALGAPIDGIWWCPHHPEGIVDGLARRCECRKPAPGLVLQAAAALRVVRDQRSVFVGDQLGDLACAVAAGVRPILVRTGKGRRVEAEARARHPGLAVVEDLRGVPPLLRG